MTCAFESIWKGAMALPAMEAEIVPPRPDTNRSVPFRGPRLLRVGSA
jgi:hypothetical protein